MMPTDLPIADAAKVAALIWPDFVEKAGHVFAVPAVSARFLRSLNGVDTDRLWPGMDRTAVEALENHIHILDLFEHGDVWNEKRSTYRTSHPHFKLAERIGQTIARAWHAKLKIDFPGQKFRVYYTRNDNPIVRFHRVYPGEPSWLSERGRESDVARGHVLVLVT
jgi:hypothetical protein